MEGYRLCPCNGLVMLHKHLSPTMVSYWCPHMEAPDKPDVSKHLAWQELNDIPYRRAIDY
jgi:hypothetical protein